MSPTETLEKMKRIKDNYRLSCKQIERLIIEEKQSAVSEATIKKVFAKDCNVDSFSYQGTIQPIANTLFKLFVDPKDADVAAKLQDKIDDLTVALERREEKIAALEKELTHEVEMAERRVAFLKEQIIIKDKRIDIREQEVAELNHELYRKEKIVNRLLKALIDHHAPVDELLMTYIEGENNER